MVVEWVVDLGVEGLVVPSLLVDKTPSEVPLVVQVLVVALTK